MKQYSAAIVAVGGVLAALILVVGLNMASQGAFMGAAPKKDPPVTTPVGPPQATVDPSVAAEMNGKPGKVKIAGKIKMHEPRHGLGGLVGHGQGNGCFKQYGDPGQCLPLLSPAQQAMPEMDHPWTCEQVRQLFPEGISVHGQDPLELDTDADRILCGPGDG